MSKSRFTDDEIIKGMECCFGQELCSECPYEEFVDCVRRKEEYAIDLLRHYKAEVKALHIANEKMYTAFREQEKTIETIFSELETEITAALESNYRAKAERLKHPNIDMADDVVAYCEGKIHALRGISEFIEEVKKKHTEGEDEL